MLKSRNSFFSESSMNYQNYYPNYGMQQPMMPQMNVQSGSQQNSFYSGPVNNIPNQNSQMPNYNYNYNNFETDYDNRLAKIERQINRLDARISKIENTALYPTEEIDTTTNMYMV